VRIVVPSGRDLKVEFGNCAAGGGGTELGKVIPEPSILDEFEYLGYIYGARRWRSDGGKRLYTWDSLHGEVEVYNARGKHLGVMDAETGRMIGEPVRGRKIDV
jgi:hypothetical protein